MGRSFCDPDSVPKTICDLWVPKITIHPTALCVVKWFGAAWDMIQCSDFLLIFGIFVQWIGVKSWPGKAPGLPGKSMVSGRFRYFWLQPIHWMFDHVWPDFLGTRCYKHGLRKPERQSWKLNRAPHFFWFIVSFPMKMTIAGGGLNPPLSGTKSKCMRLQPFREALRDEFPLPSMWLVSLPVFFLGVEVSRYSKSGQ